LTQLSYDPVTGVRASEDALADYLVAARQRFAELTDDAQVEPEQGALSAEFEHLRWFDLPAASLR
jgi:hypothetical protein